MKHRIVLKLWNNSYLPSLNFDGHFHVIIGSSTDTWLNGPMRFRMMKWKMRVDE